MPPHGGGHGGGGHHHHGGGGFGPGLWWGGGGPWGGWWDYPTTNVVVIDPSDDKKEQQQKLQHRAMATILSLPKNQRAAAYKKMFGQSAPPGVLGDFASTISQPWFWGGAALGITAVWFLFFRKKRNPSRRRRRRAGRNFKGRAKWSKAERARRRRAFAARTPEELRRALGITG